MTNELDQLKDEMSGLAEQIALEFDLKLDYSNESIRNVEKILSDIHRGYKKSQDDEGFTGIAFEFGAYIVKVIEKNVGPVRWERNHPDFGDDAFPLYIGEETIFPVNWCTKRLYDGPEDNIWTKYCFLVLKQDPPNEKKGLLGRFFGK